MNKCKHDDDSKIFLLGRQSNHNPIYWCSICGSAKFGKGTCGPIGGAAAKWYKPQPAAIPSTVTEDGRKAIRLAAISEVVMALLADRQTTHQRDEWAPVLKRLQGETPASVVSEEHEPGFQCICPDDCDCEDPDGAPALVSNHCPVHNDYPAPWPSCGATVHRGA